MWYGRSARINVGVLKLKLDIRIISNHLFPMSIPEQIDQYIASQPESKRNDMEQLHRVILQTLPGCKLWFLDGKNSEGKVVSNPNAGYGSYTINYADGSARDFYQIGMSANTTGISIYILGMEDKTYLAETFGGRLGKASVTGYCIKFKRLGDINLEVLTEAIGYGAGLTGGGVLNSN